MKIKKTLYNWLTNRFLLIIRNEENFAEKRTFSFNYAKLIVFTISFLVLVFSLSFYLLNTVLFSFLNPEYNEIETNKKIVFLTAQVDSLNSELRKKDLYGQNLYRILSGKPEEIQEDSLKKKNRFLVSKKINLDSLSQVDIQIRKEVEEGEGLIFNVKNSNSARREIFFVKPVDGVLESKFDTKTRNFGVEIATKSGEIVKAIAEGVVIWANYSDEGYFIGIQHKNGFISVYKQMADIMKEPGEFVDAGEAIAVSDEKKDKSVQPMVYFELWKEGIPLNPENYISF